MKWLFVVLVAFAVEVTPIVLNPVGICEGTGDHVVCRPLTPLPDATPTP